MAENIELRSYRTFKDADADIQEYYEIKHDDRKNAILENSVSTLVQDEACINDYDFFINMNKKNESKKKSKKKHTKTKEKHSNLMDIISSELASLTIPVTESRIVIEKQINNRNTCLQTFSRDYRSFQRNKRFNDSEYGHMKKGHIINPIFPNYLENLTEDFFLPIPVSYVGPILFNDLLANYKHIDSDQSAKFLDIILKDIKFKHHHNYTLEDLLCKQLIEHYNVYMNLQNLLTDLLSEIKVIRETKDNLKKDLLMVGHNKKDDTRFDATIRKYTDELLQLKNKHRHALKEQQEISHKMISIWADVELVREKLECVTTPYNLKIDKQSLNKNDYEKEWTQMYEEEFSDMLTKIEYDYTTKCIEYKEAKLHQNYENNSTKKMSKPKLNINEDVIKTEIEELVNNIIKKDKLHLSLDRAKDVSELKYIRNIYSFQIYIDKVFVCESEQYTSTDNWYNVAFNESFSIEILPSNQVLRIVMLENDEKVAQHKVDLPDLKRNKTNNFTKIEFKYEKDVVPTTTYVGSGNTMKEIAALHKVRLKSNNTFKGSLVTTCEVNVKITWNENFNQNHREAIKASADIGIKLKGLLHGTDKPNIEDLTEIIGKIYEKDVSDNETIIETLNNLCTLYVKEDEFFNVDEDSAEFIRLKLLQLRASGGRGFSDLRNKMVPIHGSQISTEQLNCLQKIKNKEFDMEYLRDREAEMDPIELQRYIASKYMQKLNKKMINNLREHLMVKTRKDVVREYRDFSLRNLFSRKNNTNSSAFISNGTKQQILWASLSTEQDIHIIVQRAFNLSDRSAALLDEGENNEETIAEPVSGYKVHPLRPFVRVSYHGLTAQTVTAIGRHPSWSHTLKLSSKLEPLSNLHINIYDECKVNISEGSDDQSTLGRTVHYRYYNKWLGTVQVPLYTVLSLGTLRGTFKINTPPVLFGYETGHNKESHSLIPEIKQLMKKDTSYVTLSITTGLAHLGGFQEFNQPLPSSVEDDYVIKHLNTFVTFYTNDFPNRNISLTFIDSAGKNKCVTQFLQPTPMPDKEYFPKNPKSCGSAMSKSSGFSRSSSSKSSGRKRDVDLELSEEKESVYSQEINSKGGDSLAKTINACLRYVALIPTYEVTDAYIVTLTGPELLKVLLGSPQDHTILLASYFLYLGIKSWVAIGFGLPRGRSTYVLIQYDLTARRFVLTSDDLFKSRGFLSRNDGYLWYVCDPVTGDRHELRDVGCPLKTVDYIFDNENIWVNVQSSLDCENVSFDLSKSSDWQPVFDKNIFVMKQPIVNDSHLYSTPANVESLRHSIEIKIKGKVQKWRSHLKTIWNRYCSGLLRDTLPYWEFWSFNPSENKPPFSQKLKQLMVTYRIYGFPLNISFSNMKSVMSAVKATAVHVNDDPTVEFALGVDVFGYPNNVISVWVFLATITRV